MKRRTKVRKRRNKWSVYLDGALDSRWSRWEHAYMRAHYIAYVMRYVKP